MDHVCEGVCLAFVLDNQDNKMTRYTNNYRTLKFQM